MATWKHWDQPSAQAEATFLAAVEAIKAECRRRRLAEERATFMDRIEAVSDVQFDHDTTRYEGDWIIPE